MAPVLTRAPLVLRAADSVPERAILPQSSLTDLGSHASDLVGRMGGRSQDAADQVWWTSPLVCSFVGDH